MIFWEDKFARVTFEKDVPAVTIEWFSYATSDQFRQGIMKELEAYKTYAPQHEKLHWIAETKKMIGVSSDDILWVTQKMNPKMYAAGLRYMAVIVPESGFSKMSVNDYIRNTNPNEIEIQNFTDLDEAKKWLKTK